MPAYVPYYTSIQTGSLKAFVDQKFKKNSLVKTYVHSAHLSIPLKAFGIGFIDFRSKYDETLFEILWFTILLRTFKPFGSRNVNKDIKDLCHSISTTSKQKGVLSDIKKLEKATQEYIEQELVPLFDKKGLNLVGFSLNSDQVYASLFCYLYLKKHYPEYQTLFVFGGGLVPYSGVLKTLKRFNVDGLIVVGEGELKLEKIINSCLKGDLNFKNKNNEKYGIYHIQTLSNEKIDSILPNVGYQLESIEELPTPDYDEFFKTIKNYSNDAEVFAYLKNLIVILTEGSRGCFYGKCSFCAQNMCWSNYRQKSIDKIYSQTIELIKKYNTDKIHFCDSSADLWFKQVADLIIKDHIVLTGSFYELRSKHKEESLTALALTGCKNVQIGIETLSDTMLKKMNKGTKVIDNLRTIKYLKELEINSYSNLIIKYVTSTVQEINETKELLSLIPHWGRLSISKYTLDEHSPNYKEFRGNKNIDNFCHIPKRFYDHIYIKGKRFFHAPPKNVTKKWDNFLKWYAKLDIDKSYLYVIRLAVNKIVIKDGRLGTFDEYIYTGVHEKVYTLCHNGLSEQEISKEANIESILTKNIVNEFISKKLMILIDNNYLSLALRPKEELINGYLLGTKEKVC